MRNQKIRSYADLLYEAERDRKAIQPLTVLDPSITINDAYAIQMENVDRLVAMGHRISGKKIGLTSSGIQQQLGVNEPDYGHLLAAMHCEDGIIHTDHLILPKIEAEIAFVLAADLSGGKVSARDVIDATEYVVGAFEVVDSRIADWKIKIEDTVADNASSGRYVLGEKSLEPRAIDLAAETMRFYKNGEQVEEGSGAAVLGNPATAVAWLANCLWTYGVTLKKGEIVLSGAFSAAPEAQAGDVFRVEFSSLGVVEARFV